MGSLVLRSAAVPRPIVPQDHTRAAQAATTEPVQEGDQQAPYSGCYVYGSITLWLQNNSYGKKINANLRAVQFERDGEAFGMKPVNAEDEFEPLEGETAAPAGGSDAWDD